MKAEASIAVALTLTTWVALVHAQPTVTPATPEGAATPVDNTDSSPGSSATGNSSSTGTSPSSGAVFMPPYGVPFGGQDPNKDLPSSSRPSTNAATSSDSFDLGPARGGNEVLHGNRGTLAITGANRPPAMVVPEIYTIRRGDTLWDISEHYLDNPWQWPRLWSYNPDIRNPNWIYPGDPLRLRRGDGGAGGGGQPRAGVPVPAPGAPSSLLG